MDLSSSNLCYSRVNLKENVRKCYNRKLEFTKVNNGKKKKKSYIQALVMYFSEMVYMGMQIAIDM